jgi:hypothetical protein
MPANWSNSAAVIEAALRTILPDHFVMMLPGGIAEARRVEPLRTPAILFGPVAMDGTNAGNGHGGPVRRWHITIVDGELQSPASRRERLLDSAGSIRTTLPSALHADGVTALVFRERLLSTASILNAWEMELLEYLADPALAPPVVGSGLELLGTLESAWISDSLTGELAIGATVPSFGEVIVLEASGGSPRVGLGRVVDVASLTVECQFAPGTTHAAGSAVYRVTDAVHLPTVPSPAASGPASRRSSDAELPATSTYSARLGAAGVWQRPLRFAPLPLIAARDIAESLIALAPGPLLFIDEWRRPFDAELSTPPEWISLGDNWGAASFTMSSTQEDE